MYNVSVKMESFKDAENKEGTVVAAGEQFMSNQSNAEKKSNWKQGILLYLHDLIHMLAVIIIIFLLVFRLVVVTGSSMYSTLWDGDWLLVLSNVFYQDPEYGDIIVASKNSFNGGEAIIKRVIATEGQIVDIDFVSGTVFVDGKPLREEYTFTPTTRDEGMRFPLMVDEGCLFVMGDNRDDSLDSRHPAIGMIDKREILGKALFLFYPGTNEGNSPRNFERIGAVN